MTTFEFLSISGCLLCDELEGNSPLSSRVGVRARALIESELFLLLPDISPLIPGHCLLLPKQHYSSLATLPQDHIDQLPAFLQKCISLVCRQSAAPLLFEHGSGELAPKGGACIHHAHLHLLPLTAPVVQWMKPFGTVQHLGKKAHYDSPERSRLTDYLAYQDQRGDWFLVSELEQRPPCQFIRRRIAQELSLPEWHWESTFISKLALTTTAR
jgi:ATP adenylyltransferase